VWFFSRFGYDKPFLVVPGPFGVGVLSFPFERTRVFPATLPGNGTTASTLGLEDWVSLDQGVVSDLFYPYEEQAYFSDQSTALVEGFITTNLRPSNSSEWVTVFGGESGNNTRLPQI
jgi:hypothetical protein